MLLDNRGIGSIDAAVGVHIGAEVRCIDRLPKPRLRLRHIGCIDRAVRVRVADQDAHGNRNIIPAVHKLCGFAS